MARIPQNGMGSPIVGVSLLVGGVLGSAFEMDVGAANIASTNKSSLSTQRTTAPSSGSLTRAQIVSARRKFQLRVLKFDASQHFGVKRPYSDYVRLRITNGSDVTLPCLTVLTKRYSAGQMVGSSRAPSIPLKDLGPGESVEYDYYPRGHLDVVRVDRITAEVEGIINPDVEQFFCELQGVKG